MSWRALDEDDVIASMHSYELDAIRTAALEAGQGDPVPEVVYLVVLEFREAIRSCDENRLHPDPTYLPDAAIGHAVAKIRHRLQTRFSDSQEIGEDRRMEYRSAEKYMDDVQSCRRKVERYGADEDDPAPTVLPKISARTRAFTRAKQDGI